MSGISDHPAVVTILALAGLCTALAVLWKTVGAPTHRLGRRIAEFLDDWNGEPARPGRPAIKPMPTRMAHLEDKLEELDGAVRHFQRESTEDRADLRAKIEELADAVVDDDHA